MEKYKERKKDLHVVLIDLEKTYDRIPRSIIWDNLKNRGISRRYIEVIQDMYDRVSTYIHTPMGISNKSLFFTVILEEISKSIWETVPWCILFADDIVLVAETKEEANSLSTAPALFGYRIQNYEHKNPGRYKAPNVGILIG
ncbi:uncharacterized protein LOC130799266 [Amaranthus tricolor]|uniref:uncharacterized protein LOC130799266 n=1 Tax=Amaranthus tricolor TaxID=29722 RepID=UPI00258C64F9|nr:uncharacterized protein LOC130799266 [Amaranthus tricolor]